MTAVVDGYCEYLLQVQVIYAAAHLRSRAIHSQLLVVRALYGSRLLRTHITGMMATAIVRTTRTEGQISCLATPIQPSSHPRGSFILRLDERLGTLTVAVSSDFYRKDDPQA